MDKFISFVLLSSLISGIVAADSSAPRKAREEYGQFVSSTSAPEGDLATPAPENILHSQSGSTNPIFNGFSGASRQANSYFNGGYKKSATYSSSSEEDDGSYKPHLYGGGEYSHDGSGSYKHQDGKYVHVYNPYVHDGRPYIHQNNPYVHENNLYIHDGRYAHGQSGYGGGHYADFAKLHQTLGYAADGKYQQKQSGLYNGLGAYSYSAYDYPGYQGGSNFYNAYNNTAYQLHASGQNNGLYSSVNHPLHSSRYAGYGQYNIGYIPGSSVATQTQGASALSGLSAVSDDASSGLSVQQGSLGTVDNKIKSSGLTSTSYYSGQSGLVGGIKSAGVSTGQYQTGSYIQQYPGYLNSYQAGQYSPLSVSNYKSYVTPTYSSYSSVLPTSTSSVSSSSSKTLTSGSVAGTLGSLDSVSSTGALKTGSVGYINAAPQSQLHSYPEQLTYQSGAYNYGSYQPYRFGDSSAYAQNSGYDYSKYYTGAYPGYSQYSYPSAFQGAALKSTSVSQSTSTPGIYGSYNTGSYKTYQYPSAQSTLYQNSGTLQTSNANSGHGVTPISSLSSQSLSSSGVSDSSSGLSSVANRIINAGAYNSGQNSFYTSKVNPVTSSSITSDTSSGISTASNKVLGAGAYHSGAYSSGGSTLSTGSGSYDFSAFGKKAAQPASPIPLAPAGPLVSSHDYSLQAYPYGYHQQPYYGTLNDGRHGQGYYQSEYHSCDSGSQPGYHGVTHYSTSGNRYLPGYNAGSSYPGLYTNQILRHGLQPLAHDVLLNDPNVVAFSTTVAPLVEVSTQHS